MGLDGDAALALEVHGVEDLGLHLARLERTGELEKTVGQRRLAVVDVGDDREITNESLVHSTKRSYPTPAIYRFFLDLRPSPIVAIRLSVSSCSTRMCVFVSAIA